MKNSISIHDLSKSINKKIDKFSIWSSGLDIQSPSTAGSLNRTYQSTQHLLEVSFLRMAPSDTDNSSVQLGKYPFLNVRLVLLSRTLSPGENLHDFLGPFLPYSLLDTVVWLENQDVEVFHTQRNPNLRRRFTRYGRIG
jgi:hypothetical protein